MSPVDLSALSSFLDAREAEDEFSGVVGVWHDRNELLLTARGRANRAWDVATTIDTRFDTASVTKLFTTVGALQLVERGAFDLDTPVAEYLGLTSSLSPAITPYHFLTHTSGIADDADEERGERYEDLFVDRPNYSIVEPADALVNFIGKSPNFAPGQGCRYCNAGYVLLGLMIERASGVPYRDYVTDEVFARAGMARSGFFRMDQVESEVAEGVEAIRDHEGAITGWERNIYSYPPRGLPDGGAFVTATDLLSFHHALLDGRLLAPPLAEEMLTPKEHHSELTSAMRPMTGETHQWYTGFGFEFEVGPDGHVHSYWKEGVNVGVSALLRHYPEQQVTAVVLAIGEDAAWPVVKEIDAAVRGAGAK